MVNINMYKLAILFASVVHAAPSVRQVVINKDAHWVPADETIQCPVDGIASLKSFSTSDIQKGVQGPASQTFQTGLYSVESKVDGISLQLALKLQGAENPHGTVTIFRAATAKGGSNFSVMSNTETN